MKGHWLLWTVLALGIVALLFAATRVPRGSRSTEVPRATWPLTRNEQLMYFRLQGALPDLIVLFAGFLRCRAHCQVSGRAQYLRPETSRFRGLREVIQGCGDRRAR